MKKMLKILGLLLLVGLIVLMAGCIYRGTGCEGEVYQQPVNQQSVNQQSVNQQPVNQQPVLDPIGDKTVNEGQTLSFTISATDPDGDPLTYSASDLPFGASFNATGKFSWTPGYNQTGSYQVTFTVSDGSLTDSETITITLIDVNTVPVLVSIGDKSVDEGELLEFTISATDEDGDPLTYSASNLSDGATFNATTQTFSWTPTYVQAGVYPGVRFTVTDNVHFVSEDITITVVEVVLEAVVNIDPDTIKLGAPGLWITAYIELPLEYGPDQIDLATVRLNDVVPAVTDSKYEFVIDPEQYLVDSDGDGVLERVVKFDREAVENLLIVGENMLTISGKLLGWPAQPAFVGSDTVVAV